MARSPPVASRYDDSGASRLELRTLGSADLRGPIDDGPLREVVRQPKRLALLAYLAVATPPGQHGRNHLVGLLWPEMAPERARAALRRALYFLRQRLGDGVLVGKGADRVGVDRSRLWCDAAALDRRVAAHRFEAALELYRGELLPGLQVDGAHGFQRWLDRRRQELRMAASGSAVSLAARARVADDPAGEAAWLERAVEISPEREPVLRDLLRARARSGDRGRALETYRRWQRGRERDLGISPSAETRQLADRIRSGARFAGAAESGPDDSQLPTGSPPLGEEAPPAVVSPRRIVARELASRARELTERGPSANRVARELADEAVRLDEGSAAAHAARAEARAQAVQIYGAHRRLLRDVLEDVRRALALAPHLPEAHFSHGLALETAGRLSAATGPFLRAAELSGDEPEFAGHYGRVLMLRGEFARSLDWTRSRAGRAAPRPHLLLQLGLDHWCLGLHEEAIELYRKVREERDDLAWLRASWSFFELGRGRFDRASEQAEAMLEQEPAGFAGRFAAGDAALFARDFEGARRHYEHCYELDPESRHTGIHRSTRLALGFVHRRVGNPETGRALIEAAERDTRQLLAGGAAYAGLWVDLAGAHAALGREQQALEALERAVKHGWRQPGFMRRDPIFDALRGEDRFHDVVAFMARDIRQQRETVE
jgi:serine/threonine-protein kinase